MTRESVTGFEKLDAAVNKDSADYLRANARPLYDAVLAAVQAQKTPDAIYWHMLERVGPYRESIALRAKQAAQHFIDESGN